MQEEKNNKKVISRRPCTKEETLDFKEQREHFKFRVIILEDEIFTLQGEVKNINLALKAKIAAVIVELGGLQRDLRLELTEKKLKNLLKKKVEDFERTKLNVQACTFQLKEGVEVKEEKKVNPSCG